jgi:hypothetical protein
MKTKTLRDVSLPLGASVTSNLHGAGRKPLVRPAERSVRQIVASWANRYPGKHHSDDDLLTSYNALVPHEKELAKFSSGAPRLFAALTSQLASRGLLAC